MIVKPKAMQQSYLNSESVMNYQIAFAIQRYVMPSELDYDGI